MIAGLADTHSAIWFLYDDGRLSAVAKSFFEKAAAAGQKIALSPISLAEVVYLVEKSRIPPSAFADLQTAIGNPNHVLEEAPLTAEVVEAMRLVPWDAVPDLPDRIVAATAVFLHVPVISRDRRIRASTVQTVW
jgi:PIN domain nuclease of toxin-antitoxin system